MDCEEYCETTANFREDLRVIIGLSSKNTDNFILGVNDEETTVKNMRILLNNLTVIQQKYRKRLTGITK